jgi:DNA-binding MarR family transcriptional regulator
MRGLAAHEEGETAAHIEAMCVTAIHGRRAARVVAEWAKRIGLTEAELQLLWRLRSALSGGIDQTALASALAFSPAQISASVERLKDHGCVSPVSSAADRRRRHWQLSTAGRELLDQMLVVVALQRREPNGDGGREVAA